MGIRRMMVWLMPVAALGALALAVVAYGAGEKRAVAQPPAGQIDWARVGEALGKPGQLQPGGVYRVGFPRWDLRVRAGRVRINPALALGTYAAFMQTGPGEAMVMGDLVLTEREYNRVISRLQAGGIDVTAIHKHLPAERPALWWTHYGGRGDPIELARTVRAALELTRTPFDPPPAGPGEPALDTQRLDEIIGHKGTADGGVYKFTIGRAEPVREGDMELPPATGVATALNFQPVGHGRAAINGDFVMTAPEVNKVIGALRAAGIQVVSLHNHGLGESPRLFYTHFWAVDDAITLARGLRAALDQTASQTE